MKICTLAIGSDFKNELRRALASKKEYATAHGYTYIQGGEEYWNRSKPIPWSKIPFILDILSQCEENELIFVSDADVLITNMDIKIEEHILPLIPLEKDLLLSIDSCGHLNDGNIVIRNTEWSRNFWKRVDNEVDLTYHVWWENAAVIKLLEENPDDLAKTQITAKHKLFNAYIQGLPNQPLWTPGDFLVHFAGVYSTSMMNTYIDEILAGGTPRKSMF